MISPKSNFIKKANVVVSREKNFPSSRVNKILFYNLFISDRIKELERIFRTTLVHKRVGSKPEITGVKRNEKMINKMINKIKTAMNASNECMDQCAQCLFYKPTTVNRLR